MEDVYLDMDWEFNYGTKYTEKDSIDANIFPFMLMNKNAEIIADHLVYKYSNINMVMILPTISVAPSQKMNIIVYTTETTVELLDELSAIMDVFTDLFMREDYWSNLIDFDRYFNIRSVLDWDNL